MASELGMPVDDLLHVYTLALSYAFQTIVEQGLAILAKVLESQGRVLSPTAAGFPELLRFGVPSETACILGSEGVRHRSAQVALGTQREVISESFSDRRTFLTEMALDPPQATSDLAGPPLLDEDYLVLSTVHSAKGQEWDAVYVLNVSDGSFPSEFATGRAELIEEERRLLYVAMTRAKTSLDLLAPVKYFVTQQSRMGDRHVYGARSRFLTAGVMACFESLAWSDETTASKPRARGGNVVDVAAKLRSMW